MVLTARITIRSTDDTPEFIDITKEVIKQLKKSSFKNGQVLVYARHTTAAIVLQESEVFLKEDLKNFLRDTAPKDTVRYKHSNAPDHIVDHSPNGHSHCQHLFLGASETIPFSRGKLLLGTYQRIFLVELDHARSREVVVQILGE